MEKNILSTVMKGLEAAIIVLILLQAMGYWPNAIRLYAPCTATVILLQGVQNGKKNRGTAIACFIFAAFLYGISTLIWTVS